MKIKNAYLQITRKCNNECVFCSNPQFDKDYSLEEAKEQVLEFKKEGIKEIILTGGEPTCCDFLPEIIKFIMKSGMTVKLITNGVNLEDKSLAKKLYEAGLRDVHVSIHSHKKEVADELSQKKGHWEKATKGIRNCLNLGTHVFINSTINSKNYSSLPGFVLFMANEFPEVSHYVFNALDPGKADGNLKSRAGENSWVVARLTDLELPLKKSVGILKQKGKTFRVERIPLCYMPGFEEFSTETRKIVKKQEYVCSFIEKEKENQVRKVPPGFLRVHVKCCEICSLNKICAGIQQEYLDIRGRDEIYPVFVDANKITSNILKKP